MDATLTKHLTRIIHVFYDMKKGGMPVELEFRRSSCSESVFRNAIDHVRRYRDGEWSSMSMMDVFYKGRGGRELRTSVTYDIAELTLDVRHIEKRRLEHVRVLPGVKYVLSEENIVDESEIPDAVEPSLVRIKHRRSFLYTPKRCNNAALRYDFTVVYAAPTKKDALAKETAGDATYDVELELLGTEYVDATSHLHVVCSMFMKMFDLCRHV